MIPPADDGAAPPDPDVEHFRRVLFPTTVRATEKAIARLVRRSLRSPSTETGEDHAR